MRRPMIKVSSDRLANTPLAMKAVVWLSEGSAFKPRMPVTAVRHKNSQANLFIRGSSENPVFRSGCGLSVLGQAYRRLRSRCHHRQLRALLQVMGHCLADLCGIVAACRLKMKHQQCSQGYGVEG